MEPTSRWRSALAALLAVVLAAASLAPAALLVRQQQASEQSMLDAAERRVAAITRITALAVDGVLRRSRDALDAQAASPEVVAAFSLPPGPEREAALDAVVLELQRTDSAAVSSLAVEPDGRLVRGSPSLPELQGLSFADRDWYRGALAQYRAHVSEGFRSALDGSPLLVAVARAVRDPSGRVVGLLSNGIRLDRLQEIVDAQTGLPGLRVTVVDRHGQVLARTGGVTRIHRAPERQLRDFAAGSGPRSGRPARAQDGEVWSLSPLADRTGLVLVETPGTSVVGDLPQQAHTTRTVLLVITLVLVAGGAAAVGLGRSRLAAQRSAQDLLATVEAQRAQLALSARMVGLGHFSVGPESTASTYSDEVLALWGLAPDDPRREDGRLFREQVVHPDEREELVRRLERVLEHGGSDSWVHRTTRLDDGSPRDLRITVQRGRDADGRLEPIARGGMLDVTELVEAQRRLRAAAEHDALTGLPNRALLADRLGAALARSSRTGQQVAVLMVDLDGFKRVNDTAGHAAGDALLVEVARRLSGCVRAGDTVARLGGDEFVLVLEHSPEDELDAQAAAVLVARRVRELVSAPVVLDGVAHHVTASTGLAFGSRPDDGPDDGPDDDPERLLGDADAAMYRAKAGGKDRYEVFEAALRAEAERAARVEQLLREALDARSAVPLPRSPLAVPRLWTAYQAVVAHDGVLLGFEALARLTAADGTPVPPDEFVRVAEGAGLVGQLGSAVLDDALAACARFRRTDPRLQVAVNLSALQTREPAFVDAVRAALARHGLPPSALVLEVTESVLLETAGPEGSALRGLHALGVAIAIDDFGTGYASLRYLTELPATAVKVDRSFVAGLPDDPARSAIVAAVAALAAELGLDCVAEGVETEEQRQALPAGVAVQGYLLARPLPVDEVDLSPRPPALHPVPVE